MYHPSRFLCWYFRYNDTKSSNACPERFNRQFCKTLFKMFQIMSYLKKKCTQQVHLPYQFYLLVVLATSGCRSQYSSRIKSLGIVLPMLFHWNYHNIIDIWDLSLFFLYIIILWQIFYLLFLYKIFLKICHYFYNLIICTKTVIIFCN